MRRGALRSNYQKYSNPNPIHQWLLRHFLERVAQGLAKALKGMASPSLLDVGCGEGYVLRYLRDRWPRLPMKGVDEDREALARARASNREIAFCQADASQLPFPKDAFHIVLCLEVLEHLTDPVAALEELRRVGKGPIFLSVPHQPFFSLANFLRGKNLSNLGEDVGHLHHWTASRFIAMVRQRLRVREVSFPFPWVLLWAEK